MQDMNSIVGFFMVHEPWPEKAPNQDLEITNDAWKKEYGLPIDDEFLFSC